MHDVKQLLDGLLLRSRPDRPAWNLEVLLGHIAPAWNYIDGCMIKAVLEMHRITRDAAYREFADRFVDYYIAPDGGILGYVKEDYNSDNINEGKVLFELLDMTGKTKYEKALRLLHSQLDTHPRTRAGNFWHKKIYPNQVWLDGLYMTLPFHIEFGLRFGQPETVADAAGQMRNVHDLMRDPRSGLIYHGYDEARLCAWADPETGCSRNFWTRSLGWYCMALVDSLELIPEADFAAERNMLASHLGEVLDALHRVADPATGMFHQVTDQGDRPGNYLETSGTSAIAYVLMKGARLGVIPADRFGWGERAWRSVAEHKLEVSGGEFTLKDICLVAGLGVYPGRGEYKERDGSYEYYISEPRVANDAKGVAPFLLAFTELYRRQGVGA